MQEPDSRRETSDPTNEAHNGSFGSAHLQSEQRQSTNAPKSQHRKEYPEDEIDRQFRAFEVWFYRRLKQASLIDAFQIVVGIAVFVIGVIAAFIYQGQLMQMRKASQDSNQIQILNNLPLVLSDGFYANWDNIPGDPPSIWIRQQIKNDGETRAVNPEVFVGWGYDPPHPGIRYQFDDKGWASWTWVKGREATESARMPLADATKFAAFAALDKPVYVYGRIKYSDLFPIDQKSGHSSAKHLVEYCWRITYLDTGEKTRGKSTQLIGKPYGNACIDDACPDYNSQ